MEVCVLFVSVVQLFFWYCCLIDLFHFRNASFLYLLVCLSINMIFSLGLSPHCRSLTSSSPCPCPMMYPLPLALDTISMCLGASRGLERNCCCSTTRGKVKQNSTVLFDKGTFPDMLIWTYENQSSCILSAL